MLRKKASRLFERCLLVAGVTPVAVYLSALLHQTLSSRFALWQFEKAQAAAEQQDPTTPPPSKGEEGVDFTLWAEKRIQGYKNSLLSKADPPLAVLEISKLRIRVPVFDGTDDLTLNRGVGRIVGTAKPGEPGNIGIAGHRDGFFRGLKDIAVGDEIDLTMTAAKAIYVVDQIEIVSPADVQVLRPRGMPSLTLVTCYPFYFVGDAPKRFIVHAALAPDQRNNKIQTGASAKRKSCQRDQNAMTHRSSPRTVTCVSCVRIFQRYIPSTSGLRVASSSGRDKRARAGAEKPVPERGLPEWPVSG